VEFHVIHRWLFVVISQQETFIHVHVKDPEASNWEQNWNLHTVHETDANLHDDRRVFEMHHVFWTRVKINVLFLSFAFGCILVLSTTRAFSAVYKSLKLS